jgi:hypothetical protein
MRTVDSPPASPSRHGRRIGVMICLGLVLLLQVLAASEALHKAIHPQAHSPQHQCVISLFAQGQVNAANVSLPGFVFVGALIPFLLKPDLTPAPSFNYPLPPSRGPPRF